MKGKRGRPPVAYPVRDRLMTVRQIADEFAMNVSTIYRYRNAHRGPDGTPIPMQAVYEHYMRVREGREPRYPGRPARAYALPDGRQLTAAQMAREVGMRVSNMYRDGGRMGRSVTDVYLRRVQKKRTAGRECHCGRMDGGKTQ